nr:hypothetical protein [Candidatus Nanopelagicales bacterium]
MQLFYGKPHASASDGVIYIPGATITTPIRLSRLPLLENEAASKSYVDSAVQNLNVSRLSDQALAVSNLPAIGGHFYSLPGTNLTMYQPTGVTPGWMSSVTVNSRGQVISGTDLIAEDFPNLDYSLVSSGQPTDLAGLGITDVMSDQGGAFADNVTLIGDPVQDTHAASKGYAEAIAATGGSNGLSVGDIVAIYNPQASDEEGLLRANGGQVNIADFPALYAKVGAQARNTAVAGYGRPWVLQGGGLNPTQSTNISGWQSSNPVPLALNNPSCFVTKNRVYLTAGHTGVGLNTAIYTATIDGSGDIGSWTATGNNYNTSSNPFYHTTASVILAKNKVFIFGAVTAPESSGYVSATINGDGTISNFSALSNLPFSLTGTRNNVFFKLGNKIYAVVGRKVYMAEFSADDNLGAWEEYDNMPDEYHSGGMFVVTPGFVYVINHWAQGGARSRNMLRAGHDVSGNLGGWSTVPSGLPALFFTEQFYLTSQSLYILGAGSSGTTCYRLPVYADGSLGHSFVSDNLSVRKTDAAVVAT